MCAKRGYTLVELLVVISIIALLIAIIVPSMGVVRRIMKETSCLANLHAIGAAIQTYASAYDGKVPPYLIKDSKMSFYDDTKVGHMIPLHTGYQYALAFDNSRGDGADLAPGNLGCCYRDELIAKPQTVYCPAQHNKTREAVGFHSADEYPEHWGYYYPGAMHMPRDSFNAHNKGWIATGYSYNPLTVYRSATAYAAAGLFPKYSYLEEMPSDHIIAHDVQLLQKGEGSGLDAEMNGWVAHIYRGPQWNVLFADGRAACAVWDWNEWIDFGESVHFYWGSEEGIEDYVKFQQHLKDHVQ